MGILNRNGLEKTRVGHHLCLGKPQPGDLLARWQFAQTSLPWLHGAVVGFSAEAQKGRPQLAWGAANRGNQSGSGANSTAGAGQVEAQQADGGKEAAQWGGLNRRREGETRGHQATKGSSPRCGNRCPSHWLQRHRCRFSGPRTWRRAQRQRSRGPANHLAGGVVLTAVFGGRGKNHKNFGVFFFFFFWGAPPPPVVQGNTNPGGCRSN